MDSGETVTAPINYDALSIAAKVMGLVRRGIESGELQPSMPGGKCFKPLTVISYLNQRSIPLPSKLLAALPKLLELEKKEPASEIVEELHSRPVSQSGPIDAPHELTVTVSTRPRGGRPRTIDKKAELLRRLIAQFELAAGKRIYC